MEWRSSDGVLKFKKQKKVSYWQYTTIKSNFHIGMKNLNESPKKILFAVGIDKLKSKFKRLSSPRIREYASFHGFEYHEITEYPKLNRKPHWIKIDYILKLIDRLNEGDLICYLDADIAIVRGDRSLNTNKSIGLAKDSSGFINTGVIAVRVSDFSKKFFEDVWNKTDCFNHNWQENLAAIKLLDKLSETEMEKHVEILPNSFNVTLVQGEFPLWDRNIKNPCTEAIRFRHFAGGQPWLNKYFGLPISWDGILDESNLPFTLQGLYGNYSDRALLSKKAAMIRLRRLLGISKW